MQKKLLAKNTMASLLAQVTVLVCGFILPRFFLQSFGSEVNGMVNSIAQFLGVISFLELGVGAVVESALYKPLAEKNNEEISKVMASANKFFQRLAQILAVYVIVLIFIYPFITNQGFGFLYTATLILAISISSFAQYYFGITNALLLNADQHGYIQYNAQTITVILNTVMCVALISVGGSVQLVKLVSSLIFLIRPIALRLYVDKKYKIDWHIHYDDEPIKQKWNGVAQHIAAVVLDGTDTIVLTILSTLSNVSIYSVYSLVVRGVKTLFLSMTNGIQALIGELWAKHELKRLNDFFALVEWVIHTGTTFVFSCTAALIVPFVQVYTLGITDANYIQPIFAVLLTMANAMHCLRLPYNIMVLAAGHYRQTQKNYIVAAVLNIVVSVLTVKAWGLIGVAIGTLAAMAYQTVWLAVYDSKHFIFWPIKNVAKQFAVDVLSAVLILALGSFIGMNETSYIGWIFMAVKVAVCAFLIMALINLLLYRNMICQMVRKLRKHEFNDEL